MAACLVVLAEKWPKRNQTHFKDPFWRINEPHDPVEVQVIAVHVGQQQDISGPLLSLWCLSNLHNMHTCCVEHLQARGPLAASCIVCLRRPLDQGRRRNSNVDDKG
jgi:hypothetical protein